MVRLVCPLLMVRVMVLSPPLLFPLWSRVMVWFVMTLVWLMATSLLRLMVLVLLVVCPTGMVMVVLRGV